MPAKRRRLLLSLFEQVWEDDGRIVAVKPAVASSLLPSRSEMP